MNYRVIICFCCIFLAVGFQKNTAQQKQASKEPKPPFFLKIKAAKSDDLPKLLERYGLYDYECNISKFFSLNALKEDYRLKPGKEYLIPIQIIQYNGKSIRTSLKINDLEKGIRIRDFNLNAKKKGLRKDDFVESKNLWVPWHELECTAEGENGLSAETTQSTTAGFRVFPIFGKTYQKTPLTDKKLKGKVFYVVSGHGGPDGGAEGKRAGKTLCEDEYAYDVSLRLVRLLISHGATAYMMVRDEDDGIRDEEFLKCDKDEKFWGNRTMPLQQKKRLFQRSDLINLLTDNNKKSGVTSQTLIEIHVDSRSRNARTDVFFYYRNGSESSEKLAKKLQNTFYQKYLKIRATRRYAGTVTPRDLHMLRETKTPTAVYVELGNIRNFHDQQRLVLAKNRQTLATWLCEGIMTNK